jgi:hypothetical protein
MPLFCIFKEEKRTRMLIIAELNPVSHGLGTNSRDGGLFPHDDVPPGHTMPDNSSESACFHSASVLLQCLDDKLIMLKVAPKTSLFDRLDLKTK